MLDVEFSPRKPSPCPGSFAEAIPLLRALAHNARQRRSYFTREANGTRISLGAQNHDLIDQGAWLGRNLPDLVANWPKEDATVLAASIDCDLKRRFCLETLRQRLVMSGHAAMEALSDLEAALTAHASDIDWTTPDVMRSRLLEALRS